MNVNEIYLGDAYELIKQIPDKSIDLIVTDPPYDFGKDYHGGGGVAMHKGEQKEFIKQIKESNIHAGFDASILDEFVRVMKRINIYLWCNKEQIYDYLTFFVKERGCNFEFLIWSKSNPPPFTGGHYLKDKEYCLYFWERGVKLNTSYDTAKTVYVKAINMEDKKEFLHPTIKPLDIIENLIRNSSGGGIVLDPFVGSGTTCLAAKHLGLEYIGFEINPTFHKIATDRLKGWNQKGQMNLLDI